MNDSFLADLDLIPKTKPVSPPSVPPNNRYITTRSSVTPTLSFSVEKKSDKVISSTNELKNRANRRSAEQQKKSSESGKITSSTPKSSKKTSEADENNKAKFLGNTRKIEKNVVSPEFQDTKSLSKISDTKSILKDHRHSNSSGSSCNSDATSKENNRPQINSSKEKGSQLEEKNDKVSFKSKTTKRFNESEKLDPVALLNAVKELVSRYTEEGTKKIIKASEEETVNLLKTMQTLHINSQANLIKQFMCQTDDLVKELNLGKESSNIKKLIEENENLREDNILLRARVEVLQKKLEEFVLLKEENISLRLKIKELQK